MRYLVDTHVALWWFADDPALPPGFLDLLEGEAAAGRSVGLSAISLWEIAMLAARGRIEIAGSIDALVSDVESHPVVRVLPLTGRIALESTRLGAAYPRDPADRMIGATARCHALRLITADQQIRSSGMISLA